MAGGSFINICILNHLADLSQMLLMSTKEPKPIAFYVISASKKSYFYAVSALKTGVLKHQIVDWSLHRVTVIQGEFGQIDP